MKKECFICFHTNDAFVNSRLWRDANSVNWNSGERVLDECVNKTNTHTHTYTHIYIYMFVCVCVCNTCIHTYTSEYRKRFDNIKVSANNRFSVNGTLLSSYSLNSVLSIHRHYIIALFNKLVLTAPFPVLKLNHYDSIMNSIDKFGCTVRLYHPKSIHHELLPYLSMIKAW